MKAKYLMILFLGAITIASCKKDRTCECTTTYNDGSTDTYESGTYKKVTKRFMKNNADCVSYEYESTSGNTTKEECEIK
jgi:hypothetical protein